MTSPRPTNVVIAAALSASYITDPDLCGQRGCIISNLGTADEAAERVIRALEREGYHLVPVAAPRLVPCTKHTYHDAECVYCRTAEFTLRRAGPTDKEKP